MFCCWDSLFCYTSPKIVNTFVLSGFIQTTKSVLCALNSISNLFSSFGLTYRLHWECPLYICFRDQLVSYVAFIHRIHVYTQNNCGCPEFCSFVLQTRKKKCFILGIQLYCPANVVALLPKARKLRNLPSASLYYKFWLTTKIWLLLFILHRLCILLRVFIVLQESLLLVSASSALKAEHPARSLSAKN